MLGKITEIKNNYCYMLNNNIKEDIIDLYVKIINTEFNFIGEIINVNPDIITIKLVGELNKDKFIYGIRKKPNIDSEVYLLKKEEIDILFGINNYNSFNSLYVGRSSLYNNYPIYMNINNLFSNHLVILGNTGSGKSCGIARILQNLFYKQDAQASNATFFIIDAYGEYKNAFSKINYIHQNFHYKNYTTELSSLDNLIEIPLWLLSLDDICLLLEVNDKRQIPIIEKALKIVSVFLKQSEKQVSYQNSIIAKAILDIFISGNPPAQLRDQIFSVLTRYHTKDLNLDTPIYLPGYTRPLKQCLMIDETGKIRDIELVINFLNKYVIDNIDLELPDKTFKYTLKDLLYAFDFALIDEGLLNDPKIYDLANSIRVKLSSLVNSEYNKFFQFNNYFTLDEFLYNITHLNGEKAQIININLSNIDDRFAKNIAKIYARILFDYNKNNIKRLESPFHFVIEEAHRYVQNDSDINIIGYNIFERIAKEGRKYAVLLSLISQRPSELSETVMSQVNNYIIFKITHPKDILYIKEMIPYLDNDTLENIKNLQIGYCYVFGVAFVLPTIIKMDMATPSPMSQSPNISKAWFKEN